MTFISCSDIKGLQILDRKSNSYFHCEPLFDSTKHIFVIAGRYSFFILYTNQKINKKTKRKMELFSWKKPIKPTWHQVEIPLATERFSLLYFMEIQKDH